jgi:flagellar assembly factor FliW
MEINTKYHGIRQYKQEDVFTFKNGLPGFEDLRKFILFPVEENETFSILHSIENQEVGIVALWVFDIIKDYEIDIDENLVRELNIKEEKDVVVLNTVTLNSILENITVNLKAPIVINIKERLGEQIILDKQEYSIKHPLILG